MLEKDDAAAVEDDEDEEREEANKWILEVKDAGKAPMEAVAIDVIV